MESNRILRFLPLFACGLYALIAGITGFNGLFGQDSHAYLHLAQGYAAWWRGEGPLPGDLSAAEFAPGLPVFAAFFLLMGVPQALLAVTVSGAGMAATAALFTALLRVAMPGARLESRTLYAALGLVLAPVAVKSGVLLMSDAPAMALFTACLFFSVRSIERLRPADAVAAVFFGVLTATFRYAMAVAVAPMLLALTVLWLREKRYGYLLAGVLAAAVVALPALWISGHAAHHPLQHSLLEHWSPLNLFRRTFHDQNGTVTYLLPNLVYVFYPLFHPGFCIMLPGLLLLSKRTDAALSSRRVLLICLTGFVFFLGGLSHQNVRYLLPAYVLTLVLLFPAWDRFFAYGSYFFKKLTNGLLLTCLVLQTAGIVWTIKPVVERNRLERETATRLQQHLKPGDVLYGFDLDVALKTYLPGVRHRNLWVEAYPSFEPGAWVLFNEPKLQEQWQGKNPMINWQAMQETGRLRLVETVAGGWTLYRLE